MKRGPVEEAATRKLNIDNRLHVPSSIRKQLNIKSGDTLEVSLKRGVIQFKPVPAETTEDK